MKKDRSGIDEKSYYKSQVAVLNSTRGFSVSASATTGTLSTKMRRTILGKQSARASAGITCSWATASSATSVHENTRENLDPGSTCWRRLRASARGTCEEPVTAGMPASSCTGRQTRPLRKHRHLPEVSSFRELGVRPRGCSEVAVAIPKAK